MTHSFRIAGLLVPILFLGSALAPATADPLLITAGTVSLSSLPGSVSATYDIAGPGFSAEIGTKDGWTHAMCAPCQPGESLSFDSHLLGFGGSFDIGGVHYGLVQYALDPSSGAFDFAGPSFTLPASTGATLSMTRPFTVAAYIQNRGFDPTLAVNLIGSGMATATYSAMEEPNYGTLYTLTTLTFRFSEQPPSPTPEPTTLLLVGMGIGGVVRLRRRTR